ncbi:MAG TPA: response regulator [Opitutaceae bacterium]
MPTLPRPSWPKRFSLAFAGGLIAVSLMVLAGWITRTDAWVQVSPIFAPLHANTAIGLLIIGVALLLIEAGHRSIAAITLGSAAIGGLTLLQSQTGLDLMIDELLIKEHITTQTEHAGRMSAPVALALLIAGLSVAWIAIDSAQRRRTFVIAVCGSIILSIGTSTLAGYLLRLPSVVRWGTGTSTGPLDAVALLLLGGGMLMLAWRETRTDSGRAPTWLPLPVVLGSATLTIIMWTGLRERERVYLGSLTTSTISSLAGEIQLEIERQSNAVERIARRWSQYAEETPVVWEVDAMTHLSESPAASSLVLIDPNFVSRQVYPGAGNEALIAYDHARDPVREAALRAAERTQTPQVSATLNIPMLGPGFAIYAPVYRRGQLFGFVAVEYIYRRLFQQIEQSPRFSANYDCAIQVGTENVYDPRGIGLIPPDSNTFESAVTIYERRMRIRLSPSPEYLERNRRFLPELALAAGFGITLLLGLSVHLARTAYSSLDAVERSNRRLQSENEERRRVEAMLKVSDERLRLALDSTQIGIFEWNLSSRQIYYSPGLWTMLGYQPGAIASNHDAWVALVHPDDLGAYRAALDRQLAGELVFIEPEYRVKTGDGSWRWLSARSKSVTPDERGRPSRIIGTLQDITPRKTAEEALRASQAATRKLSLVASRTDNLVLIGRPDGAIEWVNEGFTRVMEYQLEEIVGKNPATFMVGPETNPRTVRRIRAAIARGEGLSCDVVNYSKSGRKYHLHLEIQPVRNDTGGLDTFIAILADITTRVDTETALRRAKIEADTASRAKSEFLASMSHEIRTPMNGVIGMTSLLQETQLSVEQRDFVNTIRTSGESLLTIINDILDFSKIESGKMELEHLPFDLSLCLEETLDLFSVQAAGKQLELAYAIDENVPSWIVGDITRLRQVLVNLVNNAVKFTPSGGIDISVRRAPINPEQLLEPGHVLIEFEVRDSGIGIPPDRINRLFKPFSQIDSSTTRKYGGTGLGLAICHRLCSLMGGGIRVESAPGKGSSFIFTLLTEPTASQAGSGLPALPEALRAGTVLCVDDNPVVIRRLDVLFRSWGTQFASAASAQRAGEYLTTSPRPALILVDTDLLQGSEGAALQARLESSGIPTLLLLPVGLASNQLSAATLHFASVTKPIKSLSLVRSLQSLFQGNQIRTEATATGPAKALLGEEIPLRVLLVEDNAVNQKVALRFLERLGYSADAVANGLEALDNIGVRDYDLVLMDLQMPEMDGFEASRQIRRRLPQQRQPKIIALTANALQGDRELCLAAGMDDYVTKPVKLHELAAVIRRQFTPSTEAETETTA